MEDTVGGSPRSCRPRGGAPRRPVEGLEALTSAGYLLTVVAREARGLPARRPGAVLLAVALAGAFTLGAAGAQEPPAGAPPVRDPAPDTVPNQAPAQTPTHARQLLLGLQATGIAQATPRLHSPYSGASSLRGGEAGLSQTYTLFLGVRALDGLDAYLEPEAATGSAPGQGAGLAGAGDGDLLGQPGKLQVYLARAFVRWRAGIGAKRAPPVQLGRARGLIEESVPASRLVVSVGRLAVTDLLDQNAYANTARTQFLNLAFVNELAYDFPQDAHGYSQGVLASLVTPALAVRAASFLVPAEPGGALSWRMGRDRGDAVELAFSPAFAGGGVLRLLAWRNVGQMGRYPDALRVVPGEVPSLGGARTAGTVRWGTALNAELPLGDDGDTGLFARAGLAQGDVEALSFAEADGAVSAGGQVSGRRWGRRDDRVGLAAGAAFASASHRAYLAAGGTGLRLGDGALRYGPEVEAEGYYSLQLSKVLSLAADLQGILDPGMNRDRGPALLAALRVHLER